MSALFIHLIIVVLIVGLLVGLIKFIPDTFLEPRFKSLITAIAIIGIVVYLILVLLRFV